MLQNHPCWSTSGSSVGQEKNWRKSILSGLISAKQEDCESDVSAACDRDQINAIEGTRIINTLDIKNDFYVPIEGQ